MPPSTSSCACPVRPTVPHNRQAQWSKALRLAHVLRKRDRRLVLSRSDRERGRLARRALNFEWGRGPIRGEVPGEQIGTRAIFIHDVRKLGTREEFHARVERHGPIDRGVCRYLAVKSAVSAAESLRKDRIKVGFADDRCWAAGSIRAAAIRNRVRQVILNEVPLGTTVGELCDHIRGGGLERIVFVPERRVAFVHFLAPSAAAAFSRHALYQGIMLRGQRLGARMKVDKRELAKLVPHIVANVAQGASRCLRVVVRPSHTSARTRFGATLSASGAWSASSSFRLRKRSLSHSMLADTFQSRAEALVSFTDIEHAIAASRLIYKQLGYKCAQVDFAEDRCAGPLPGAQRMAQTLQAHIANFLTLKPR
ncbi:hypothetical protein B0H13DRAFT_1860008 [Mycena leptocephala]|nr:hypothetical protein B0H13DRAFT_1860008 [Mycena leptocephala]